MVACFSDRPLTRLQASFGMVDTRMRRPSTANARVTAVAALSAVLVTPVIFGTGCGQQAPPVASAAEKSWAAQIADVTQGAATEIKAEHSLIDDAQLNALPDLAGLRTLVIERSTLSDAGAVKLAQLHSLQRLAIGESQWTNNAMASIATLPRLENLLVGKCAIDDAGFRELAKLTELRFLIVRDLPITDRSLAVIQTLPKLESLYISGTQISERGLAQLQMSRPQLHIHGP